MGKLMLLVAVLGQATLLAAPVAKDGQEPVAEGSPAWKGVVSKNYLMGREITDSDLRHRVAAVIEVKADETLHAQFVKSGEMILMDPLVQQQFGVDWTTRVCKNAGEAKKIVAELNKMKKDLGKLKDSKVVVVQNGALLMDMKVDELIAQMPTKVAGG